MMCYVHVRYTHLFALAEISGEHFERLHDNETTNDCIGSGYGRNDVTRHGCTGRRRRSGGRGGGKGREGEGGEGREEEEEGGGREKGGGRWEGGGGRGKGGGTELRCSV